MKLLNQGELAKLVFVARLKTLLTKVKSLHRRDRYRLYMSMMGTDEFVVDGTDWAHTLHRMVAGSHNIASYDKRIATLEGELKQSSGLDDEGLAAAWKEAYQKDNHLLDPVLDLVHRKIEEFYAYAGRPD